MMYGIIALINIPDATFRVNNMTQKILVTKISPIKRIYLFANKMFMSFTLYY